MRGIQSLQRFWQILRLPPKRAVLLALLITLIAVFFSATEFPATTQVPPQPQREIRGVWITNVDSDVLLDRDRLSRAIQDLAQVNINTAYPVAWNWGYTSYPSPVAQFATGAAFDPRPVGLEGRDVMAEFIQQAHQQNIAVIPWFEFGFMAPEDSALALRHPDWLTQRHPDFKPAICDKPAPCTKCPCTTKDPRVWMEGTYPRVWLNPFKPEVQQFILDLVLELVTRYDIDGIQFDDHFGLPVEFGYDPFTIQLYRSEHQGQSPPADFSNPEWKRWRANKITDFMGRAFREIKSRNPQVLVTLSPNNYDHAYNQSLQDWRTWEQQGFIEELVLQVYRDSRKAFLEELNAAEVQSARRHIPTAIGVLTGLKKQFVPIQQVQDQVQLIRSQKFAGLSFFFYETMWNLVNEPIQARKAGFKILFPTPAARPRV